MESGPASTQPSERRWRPLVSSRGTNTRILARRYRNANELRAAAADLLPEQKDTTKAKPTKQTDKKKRQKKLKQKQKREESGIDRQICRSSETFLARGPPPASTCTFQRHPFPPRLCERPLINIKPLSGIFNTGHLARVETSQASVGGREGGQKVSHSHINGVFHRRSSSDVVSLSQGSTENTNTESNNNNNNLRLQSDEKTAQRLKSVASCHAVGAVCCLGAAKVAPEQQNLHVEFASTPSCRHPSLRPGSEPVQKPASTRAQLKWPLELNAKWRHHQQQQQQQPDNDRASGSQKPPPIIGPHAEATTVPEQVQQKRISSFATGKLNDDDDDDDDDDNLMIDHASQSSSSVSRCWCCGWGQRKQPLGQTKAQNIRRMTSGKSAISPCGTMRILLTLFLLSQPLQQNSSSSGITSTAAASVAADDTSRQHFWRQLLTPLLASSKETSGETPQEQQQQQQQQLSEALNRIAKRFSEWPDRRRAALSYLDLVARRFPTSGVEQPCRRVSFAELESGQFFADTAIGRNRSIDWASQIARKSELRNPPGLVAQLKADARFAHLAQVAVDNANLITRLLLSQAGANSAASGVAVKDESEVSDPLKEVNSRGFYEFLLRSKVEQIENSSRNKSLNAFSSLGLIFVAASSNNNNNSQLDQLPSPEFALKVNHYATHSGSSISHPSWDLIESENRILKSSEPQNSYFGRGSSANIQPFYAKWVADKQSVGLLEHKLRSQLEQEDWQRNWLFSLTQSDGHWFSPYFDCAASNSWLLTYSIPFFGASFKDNERTVGFRGVSFVSLDLGKTQLIDQCASDSSEAADDGAFFANTHQCARLQWGQCIRLPEYQGVRSGAYVCQCPSGGQVPSDERRANEERRERLVEQLMTRAAANASAFAYAFEQLTFEQDEWLSDRTYVLNLLKGNRSNQLNHRHQSDTSRNFALGSQLESDANLEWFSRDSLEASNDLTELDSGWPKQMCRFCRNRTKTITFAEVDSDSSEAKLDTTQLDVGQEEDNCREESFHPISSSQGANWIRPLVATVQSLCILVTLSLIGVLMRVRRSRIILASGWLMLETILIGALLLYTSVLVRYFEPTSISCLIEPWLRELGFSIFYGSILIKLYKILTEFQTRKAHRVLFRDKDQLVYLLAIILIVVGYMSAWTALMIDGFFFGRQSAATDNGGGGGGGGDDTAVSPIKGSDGSLVASAMEQLGELAPEQFRTFARRLSSLTNLFSGLVEEHRHYERRTDSTSFSMRCRKLTWDYVTELSEIALLLFGINLVYKLRNASSEAHKEKLVLSAAVFIELFVSGLTYTSRHLLWNQLTSNQILLLYCARCHLTVSITLGLVFGPKLYLIGKSRPTLFSWRGNRAIGGSTRHRCHISCELHDHHLDDAMRLHQAMLSNAALDIGSINLADMDPDEIQAELKRVYAQLEMLKTKAMRRDNPHISKRRGGRKTGHRKFSLQAFHAKHLGSHHAHANQQHPQQPSSDGGCTKAGKLPVLVEQENNQCTGGGGDLRVNDHHEASRLALETCNELDESLAATAVATHKQPLLGTAEVGDNAAGKRTQRQVHSGESQEQQQQQQKLTQQQHKQHRHRHHHHHHHHHHHGHNHQNNHNHNKQQATAAASNQRRTVILAEPNSTSSAGAVAGPFGSGVGVNDDDTLILNDSQSSGNASLHRQSSYVCSQSSIHPEDSSLN